MALPQQMVASLYVGDLQHDVTEALLFQIFSQYGPVSSVRVCRDYATKRSLGYAYVNFQSHADAERALDLYNFQRILATPCRIMWSSRDPSARKSAVGNLFIKNLDPEMDNKTLFDTFSNFGNILSCKIALDRNKKSKGFGFVHFDSNESAKKCIEEVNGKLIKGKIVYIAEFQRRINRATTQNQFTNLYIKEIPQEWNEEKLKEEFNKFGVIKSLAMKRGQDGKHLGFGFIDFASHEEALRAIEGGKKLSVGDNKFLFVCRFQTTEERKATLDKQISDYKKENYERFKGRNLHIKNLEEDVDEEELKKFFQQRGKITSVKIERDANGRSKCFGYVCYETQEEAKSAVELLNMQCLEDRTKPVYVAMFQTKEERKVFLDQQQQHQQQQQLMSNMRAPIPASYPMMVPQYQGHINQMLHQPQYMSSQRTFVGSPMLPAIRPNPMSFIGGRQPRQQRPVQQLQQQPQQQQQRPVSAVYPQRTPATIRGNEFTVALANANPDEQKHMLGEKLFPLVYNQNATLAAKITGMILELEVNELLAFLESPEQLKEKIAEAVRVLEEHSQTQ